VATAYDVHGAASAPETLSFCVSDTGTAVWWVGFSDVGDASYTVAPMVIQSGEEERVVGVYTDALFSVRSDGSDYLESPNDYYAAAYCSQTGHVFAWIGDHHVVEALDLQMKRVWYWWPGRLTECGHAAVSGNRVYFLSNDDSLRCLVDDGDSARVLAAIGAGYRPDCQVPPVIDPTGHVCFVDDSCYFYRYTPDLDSLLYRVRVENGPGPFTGIAVYSNQAYISSAKRGVHAVTWHDGQTRWTGGVGSEDSDQPVTDGSVVVAVADSVVFSLDALSGAELWRTRLPAGELSTPLLAADGKVYVAGRPGLLCCLDLGTGELLWCCDYWSFVPDRAPGMRGDVTELPAPALLSNGNVVVIDGWWDGVICIRGYEGNRQSIGWSRWGCDSHNSNSAYGP
jgi:outer membrane protein assembly factor BamB